MIKARGRVKVTGGCHLMMSSMDTSDAGNYTCYVSNVAATKSVRVMLTVAGARHVIIVVKELLKRISERKKKHFLISVVDVVVVVEDFLTRRLL